MLNGEKLREAGVHQWGLVSPGDVEFKDEIRAICQGNSCRRFGTTWACPPAVGTVEQCRARCLGYENALVFNGVYPLAESFDYEGMMAGHRAFKDLCDRVYKIVRSEYADFLLLSNEGCTRCAECTYPKGECRMPELLFPSIEGYGIDVMALAKKAGTAYNNGSNTVTYFGMVLF